VISVKSLDSNYDSPKHISSISTDSYNIIQMTSGPLDPFLFNIYFTFSLPFYYDTLTVISNLQLPLDSRSITHKSTLQDN